LKDDCTSFGWEKQRGYAEYFGFVNLVKTGGWCRSGGEWRKL